MLIIKRSEKIRCQSAGVQKLVSAADSIRYEQAAAVVSVMVLVHQGWFLLIALVLIALPLRGCFS